MIEIVASVCMIANPGACKDVHLSFAEESVTPQQCFYFGQIELAKWSEGHPNWTIQRWKCGQTRDVANL